MARFLQDCDERFTILPVDRTVIDRAVDLTRHHRLRGYDAVQLARALMANETLVRARQDPLIFVSSDVDLLIAARNEGLAVGNPLDHPDRATAL